MDQRQRIGMQRAMAAEALGKLDAITQLFGIEDGAVAGEKQEAFNEWVKTLDSFKRWVWEDSPIA